MGEDDAPAGLGEVLGVDPLAHAELGLAVANVPRPELVAVGGVGGLAAGEGDELIERQGRQKVVAVGAVDPVEEKRLLAHRCLLV